VRCEDFHDVPVLWDPEAVRDRIALAPKQQRNGYRPRKRWHRFGVCHAFRNQQIEAGEASKEFC
jgi:hypothetical protein